MSTIGEYEKLSGGELNAVKVVLADEATRLLHGDDCLAGIHAAARTLFANATATAPASATTSTAAGFSSSATGRADLDSLVKVQLLAEDLVGFEQNGVFVVAPGEMQVVELLLKAGFAATKSEGRRLIELGGARVNDVKVSDIKATVSKSDFDEAGRLKLSGSKKKHCLILKP